MKIEYIKGDLLHAKETYIAHGCNAQGVMRSGVAKAIRAKWPEAYKVYHGVYLSQGNNLHLGQVVTAYIEKDNKLICNCITQEFYGRDKGVQYFDYEAIRTAMRELNRDANGERIALPKIGAGLANGDWNVIEQIIEEEFDVSQPVVYVM